MSHAERHHGPLRTASLIIQQSLAKSESDADCLQLAVKSMNDILGPEDLCPTLLVFDFLTRPSRRTPAPTQLDSARALDGAPEEF